MALFAAVQVIRDRESQPKRRIGQTHFLDTTRR
jgi:hypothetical protein